MKKYASLKEKLVGEVVDLSTVNVEPTGEAKIHGRRVFVIELDKNGEKTIKRKKRPLE